MPRDLSKYLHRLDEHDDLTPAQKLSVAQAVWLIMEHLCDHAMRIDATQLALGITPAFDSIDPTDAVESSNDYPSTFRDAVYTEASGK